MKLKHVLSTLAALHGLFTTVHPAIAQTWTLTSAPSTNWSAIAASADGTKLVALNNGGIYTSSDSGGTWTSNNAPNESWSSVAASADGTRFTAVIRGGGIYTWQAASPVILSQPASPIVAAGLNATFSLGVIGALPLAYQWTSNSVSLYGANNANLTLTNVPLSASGSIYAVQVTNNLGSTWSSNAVLTVVPAIVTTEPANEISTTGAVLNGSVCIGVESVVWFEWGTDTNYGNLTGATVVPGNSEPSIITNVLAGLNEGGVYHYRLVAANDFGIVYGNDQSFVAGLIPSVFTLPATDLTTNGATLNATINPNGPDTTVYFRWGTSANYGNSTPVTDLGPGTTPVTYGFPLSGLTSGTIYHCQIVASNILGQTNGPDVTFTTGPWVLTIAPSSQGWQSIASSADGSKLLACAGSIFTSTNSGLTWQSNNAPVSKWTSVASSADGVTLAAVIGGYQAYGLIYTSTNSGASWETNDAPTLNWRSIASSADGTKMVAVSGYEGRIYTSTNAGANWTSNAAPVQPWNSVASSADGTKLVAVAYQGWIGVSTNSGATWTQTSAPFTPWFSVASSADGTRLAAAVSGAYGSSGPIYTSTNSGATWTQSGAPAAGWTSIASSADGNKLAAACYAVNTGIYTWQTTATPLLSLTLSGSDALLSWTIPSQDFTLQQNSDLTTSNWTDVPTPPVLDLTNLQNQIIVSLTNGNTFYRLKH